MKYNMDEQDNVTPLFLCNEHSTKTQNHWQNDIMNTKKTKRQWKEKEPGKEEHPLRNEKLQQTNRKKILQR